VYFAALSVAIHQHSLLFLAETVLPDVAASLQRDGALSHAKDTINSTIMDPHSTGTHLSTGHTLSQSKKARI
jgi:hypothetical protein